MSRMHKDEYDTEKSKIVKKNVRWSPEDERRFAHKEAELRVAGIVKVNDKLHEHFAKRSLDGIKYQRKKASHQEMVKRFMEMITLDKSDSEQDDEPLLEHPVQEIPHMETHDIHFLQFIRNLSMLESPAFERDRLNDIVINAEGNGKEATLLLIDEYLKKVFVKRVPKNKPQRPNTPGKKGKKKVMTKRAMRRQEYANTQSQWKKDPSRTIKQILDDTKACDLPSREVMEPFWKQVFTAPTQEQASGCKTAPQNTSVPIIAELWDPISIEEITSSFPRLSSTAGPDGITVRLYKSVPVEIITRILNLILWCGKLPELITSARTVFLAKKNDSTEPGDFRPLTIPSVIVRHMHAILAKRLGRLFDIGPQQRGFIETDGCVDNTTILDLILRYHNQSNQSVYICTIDVSKAFDSVSHSSLFDEIARRGAPEGFVSYTRNYYAASSTVLSASTWTSDAVHPTQGVRQGDPMSPVLFNLGLDSTLKQLPNWIGAALDGGKINSVAYADDLILFAQTREGLQELLEITSKSLESKGMKINNAKSLTIGIKGLGKEKKTLIDVVPFTLNGYHLPALKRTDTWKYLGVEFTPEGRTKVDAHNKVILMLERLTKAALTPQQRLFALRTVVLPRLYHQLVLGKVQIGSLRKVDMQVRRFVRKWLTLPNDFPNAFFHASISDGGLGIPSVRWKCPLLRLNKLQKVYNHLNEDNAIFHSYLNYEKMECLKRLKPEDGPQITSGEDMERMWKSKLQCMFDGKGLIESDLVAQSNRWVREPTKFLSGSDFLHCTRVKYNCLPTRSRTSRGRSAKDRMCRAGCNNVETLNHVLQNCPRTHGARIKRHDALVNYIDRSAAQRGFVVLKEKKIRLPTGINLKPDLIALNDQDAIIVDAQVVSDSCKLKDRHIDKVKKYNTSEVKDYIFNKYNKDLKSVTSLTVNWRGVLCKESIEDLTKLGLIGAKDLAVLTTRTLLGGSMVFNIFNKSTRVGVG